MTRKKYFLYSLLFFAQFMICATCKNISDSEEEFNHRSEMRSFVQDISNYAKKSNQGFYIIPQNGEQLLTTNGEPNGALHNSYLNAIDGQAREDVFFGFNGINEPTPNDITAFITVFLDRANTSGKTILVTDYSDHPDQIDQSYSLNSGKGYISFAAPRISLDVIPDHPSNPVNENDRHITQLSQAESFLYLINPGQFDTKEEFINRIQDTNYDLLIIDFFFHGNEYTAGELNELRQKANGGSRLLISYLSIGEAEEYRYYWRDAWNDSPPEWLAEENPKFPGNFKVRYWMPEWQEIIYGSPDSYLDKILSSEFDGVYLDIIDAFEYFEE